METGRWEEGMGANAHWVCSFGMWYRCARMLSLGQLGLGHHGAARFLCPPFQCSPQCPPAPLLPLNPERKRDVQGQSPHGPCRYDAGETRTHGEAAEKPERSLSPQMKWWDLRHRLSEQSRAAGGSGGAWSTHARVCSCWAELTGAVLLQRFEKKPRKRNFSTDHEARV